VDQEEEMCCDSPIRMKQRYYSPNKLETEPDNPVRMPPIEPARNVEKLSTLISVHSPLGQHRPINLKDAIARRQQHL
jgi:hypothetical protein